MTGQPAGRAGADPPPGRPLTVTTEQVRQAIEAAQLRLAGNQSPETWDVEVADLAVWQLQHPSAPVTGRVLAYLTKVALERQWAGIDELPWGRHWGDVPARLRGKTSVPDALLHDLAVQIVRARRGVRPAHRDAEVAAVTGALASRRQLLAAMLLEDFHSDYRPLLLLRWHYHPDEAPELGAEAFGIGQARGRQLRLKLLRHLAERLAPAVADVPVPSSGRRSDPQVEDP